MNTKAKPPKHDLFNRSSVVIIIDRFFTHAHPFLSPAVHHGRSWSTQSNHIIQTTAQIKSSVASRLWSPDSPGLSPLAPPPWNRSHTRVSRGTCGSHRTWFHTCTWTRSTPRASDTRRTGSPEAVRTRPARSPPPVEGGIQPAQARKPQRWRRRRLLLLRRRMMTERFRWWIWFWLVLLPWVGCLCSI